MGRTRGKHALTDGQFERQFYDLGSIRGVEAVEEFARDDALVPSRHFQKGQEKYGQVRDGTGSGSFTKEDAAYEILGGMTKCPEGVYFIVDDGGSPIPNFVETRLPPPHHLGGVASSLVPRAARDLP